MKLSMRVKLASVVALLVMMLAGSAWAVDQNAINAFFTDYNSTSGGSGTGLVGTLNGTTVEVTGEKINVTKMLAFIGDFADLTIDWQAKLTSTAGDTLETAEPESGMAISLIRISGTSIFNIKGGEISFGEPEGSPASDWPCVIRGATSDVTVNMTDGVLNMTCSEGSAIEVVKTVNASGGTINAPYGTAIGTSSEVPNVAGSTINGLVYKSESEIDVYGECYMVTEDACNWTNLGITKATLKDGASLTITRPIIGRDNITFVAEGNAELHSNFDSTGTIQIGTQVVSGKPVTKPTESKLAESGVPSDTIMPLDVFKVTDFATDNGVFHKSYTVQLNDLVGKGYTVGNLVVIKLRREDAAPIKFEKVTPGSVGNGQFSIALASGATLAAGDAIQSDVDYVFTIGIEDDGVYDWDTTTNTIVDPAGIGAESGGGSGGGGGCNVGGYGVIALLLAVVGLVTRKARKA